MGSDPYLLILHMPWREAGPAEPTKRLSAKFFAAYGVERLEKALPVLADALQALKTPRLRRDLRIHV